jgi:hypothetical protein
MAVCKNTVRNASTPKHAPSKKCTEAKIKQIKSKETTTTIG